MKPSFQGFVKPIPDKKADSILLKAGNITMIDEGTTVVTLGFTGGYDKAVEYQVPFNGSCRVSVDYSNTSASNTSYVNFYKNDIPVSGEFSNLGTSYVTATYDFIDLLIDDKISFYIKENGGQKRYRSFQIKSDKQILPAKLV